MPSVHAAIYDSPADYDLEHEGDAQDTVFYCALMDRLRPARLLEFGCGSGRLTLPIADVLAQWSGSVTGVDLSDDMLQQARNRRPDTIGAPAIQFAHGDMRTWRSHDTFDMVVIGCSSITHLLTLDDQLAVWRNAFAQLRPGGRFVLDISVPNLGSYVDSLRTPPRVLSEIDVDRIDEETGLRLVRHKTTRFDIVRQRADIQFIYDKFQDARLIERYISDFTSHVYFPRELVLLYMMSGFTIESVWGDFAFRAPGPGSRDLVMVGTVPDRQNDSGGGSFVEEGARQLKGRTP